MIRARTKKGLKSRQSMAVIPTVKEDKIMSISLRTTNLVPVSQQYPGMTVTVEVGDENENENDNAGKSTENRNNNAASIEPICNDCGSQFHIMHDPSSQYNGKGITCSNCQKAGARLLYDDFFVVI